MTVGFCAERVFTAVPSKPKVRSRAPRAFFRLPSPTATGAAVYSRCSMRGCVYFPTVSRRKVSPRFVVSRPGFIKRTPALLIYAPKFTVDRMPAMLNGCATMPRLGESPSCGANIAVWLMRSKPSQHLRASPVYFGILPREWQIKTWRVRCRGVPQSSNQPSGPANDCV